MSLADMLSKGLGSKLEGNNHDTVKEDKKNQKIFKWVKKKSTSISFYIWKKKWKTSYFSW